MAETVGGAAAHCATHPDKAALGACQHCGTFSCGDCLGMLNGRRICRTCVQEQRVTVYGIPWERRKELGIFKAWGATVWGTVSNPVGFYTRTNPQGPIGESILFALFSTGVLFSMWIALMSLIGALIALVMIAEGAMGAAEIGMIAMILGIYAIGFPLVTMIWGMIQPLIHHLVLLVIGGGTQGLRATYRAGMYSFGIVILQGIPCLNYVTWIWVAIVQGIGYSYVHRTDGWRGAAAVVVPIVMCCACCMAYYVFLFAAMEL